MAIGRFVAIGFNLIWNKFLIGHAEENIKALYVGAGVAYSVGLLIMCLMVREGQYPPVTDVTKRTTLLEKITLYFRECFTHPFFILLFVANMSTAISNASNPLRKIYLRGYLNLKWQQIGDIEVFLLLIGLALTYPVGLLIDKKHALRVMMFGILLFIPVSFFGYFVTNTTTYIIYMALLQFPDMLRDAALIPLLMALFPRDRYGQFSSANAMLRSASRWIFPTLAALFIGYMIRNGREYNYRYIFVWNGTWQVVSLALYFWLYLYWKKLGGDKGYTPPDTTRKKDVFAPVEQLGKV